MAGNEWRELALRQLCAHCNSHVYVFKPKPGPKCKVMLSWGFGEVLGFGEEVGSWVFFSADGVGNKSAGLECCFFFF